ncbi:Os08g0396500 [Oryza sativa Japonica Group]|uniref:Os08g0396500 protein n=1 Tax=Oryza sativa subsp. japonica TaxID=39947 RepID=C7J5R0_ORYSJ|nr:Os08g0396500 [Oryza sativa Japonica Group]|eukprot:NP_001175564.1 Os08g0396500 [Oryza sativa Japonica Group]
MLRTPDLGDPPVAEITHPFHPHKLRLADNVTDGHWPFRCGGCKELAAGRRRYRCEPCDLTLYTCCATAPLTLEHPLLPGRHFRLLERPPPPPPWLAADDRGGGGWRPACDACGDLLRGDGFAYHCADGHGLVGLNLHPRCARLRLPVAAARGAAAVKLCRRAAPRRRCGVCMSGEDGYRHGFWTCRFRRSGGDELVDVHLSCLKELMSHSHETLTNLYEILMEDGTPTNDCGEGASAQDNSSGESNGDAEEFENQNGTNNGMVPEMKTITHPSHPEHKLRMVTTTGEAPFKCDACKEPGDGPRYHCLTCEDLNMHKFCAHAPSTLYHHLFGRTFELLAKPPQGRPEKPHPAATGGGRGESGGRWCDTCGDHVFGLVYHCSGANLDLHPCSKITIDGVAFDIAAFSKCSLCSRQEEEGPDHCCRRLRRQEQWCYYNSDVVDGGGEAVSLHVSCIKQIARRRWQAARDMKCGGQIMLAISEEMIGEGGPLHGIPSERDRNIVGAVVRVIIAVIFGDRTAMEGDISSWEAAGKLSVDLIGLDVS